MIFYILLLIILVVWIIICVKNRKAILLLPYLLMIFITPFYNILDQHIFVEIFGCGCVPSVQTNMFNIDFNANDLRFLVYNVIVILSFILGVFLSKKLNSKKSKAIYIITILLFNSFLAYKICELYTWQ